MERVTPQDVLQLIMNKMSASSTLSNNLTTMQSLTD